MAEILIFFFDSIERFTILLEMWRALVTQTLRKLSEQKKNNSKEYIQMCELHGTIEWTLRHCL